MPGPWGRQALRSWVRLLGRNGGESCLELGVALGTGIGESWAEGLGVVRDLDCETGGPEPAAAALWLGWLNCGHSKSQGGWREPGQVTFGPEHALLLPLDADAEISGKMAVFRALSHSVETVLPGRWLTHTPGNPPVTAGCVLCCLGHAEPVLHPHLPPASLVLASPCSRVCLCTGREVPLNSNLFFSF